MKKLIPALAASLLLLLLPVAAHSQPELKGSPEELRHFLHPTERTVSIQGQAEEKAYSDQAIISLVITTEDRLLSAPSRLTAPCDNPFASSLSMLVSVANTSKAQHSPPHPNMAGSAKNPTAIK